MHYELGEWEPRITEFDKIFEGAIKDPAKAPRGLFRKAMEGTIIATSYAEILLNQALREYGAEQKVAYPDTGYHLPVITALSGEKVTKLGELVPILNRVREQVHEEQLTFENVRLAGEATLYAAEIIEALHYLYNDEPKVEPWSGFLGDPAVRRFGIKLVDWTIPGQAVIVGRAKTSKLAKKIVEELMNKGMMIFLSDEIIEQLLEEDMKMGVDYICFPLGNFTQVVHAVNYALRAGLSFGGIQPGKRHDARDYQRRRVRAFVLHLGELDEVKVAAEFGAIFLGFPVITDQPMSEELPDWFVSHENYDDLVKFAMELRGIKVASVDVGIPLNFGPSFEGETIRKNDTYVEFGGGRTPAFEVLRMVGQDEIVDDRITVIGPEIDEVKEGDKLPLGIVVKIFGRKMQVDFEPVLERRIHYFINYGEGLWHVAQRDLAWLRISKEAVAKGFKFKHYGNILIAKFKSEFPSIVDRVEVEIITDRSAVEERIKEAKKVYSDRDERMRGLTDDSVGTFYSCLLCQSFAPNHVCVVTPERVGLCGAVTWLDGKAAYEIDPTGPNRPIPKGEAIDDVKGIWKSVNDYVYPASNNTIESVALYTLMEAPMTSCGCFEAIMAVLPEANGIMIVTRESKSMTPIGMTFSTLAGMVGGGLQTPGFMGIGKSYVASRKFIAADGGIGRVVWMPKDMKDQLRDDISARAREQGLGEDFVDKIADETIGTAIDEILPFLEEKGHPALTMPPIIG
ncbi:MAG: acetyl-CoA decarbonylase/synthase complex subunit alpha/beta [Firmicutes bacterium]|nr:acetyl-CoA decarbonylase/synthase complex subunit alpha/beta [Bacillota bacterium]